jgi:hypothetical protein
MPVTAKVTATSAPVMLTAFGSHGGSGRLASGTVQPMTSPDSGLPGNIGAPATRALTAAGYTQLSQLANVPASELKKLHGVGPRALRLLQEALEQQGMSLS